MSDQTSSPLRDVSRESPLFEPESARDLDDNSHLNGAMSAPTAPSMQQLETRMREDAEDPLDSVISDDRERRNSLKEPSLIEERHSSDEPLAERYRRQKQQAAQPSLYRPGPQQARGSGQQSMQRPAQHQEAIARAIPRPNMNRPSSPERFHKKPGPKTWAAKPLTKNDMEAKKELIAEIEKFWGKGFIKNFIPKCHRPLVKRGKLGKRSAFRQSENDPKKWMPSVLKAVLMIAKKTDDKQWLKEQMRDVVTYRIKHTGNRKPQLVTTDFDVIEDVFDSGWTVAQSFTVRYKHLLMHRGDNIETDEDIAHIFGENPQDEGDGDPGSDEKDGSDDNDGEDGEEDDAGSGEEVDQGPSSSYLQSSGYIQPPSYPLPALPKHNYRQPHPGPGAGGGANRMSRQLVRGPENQVPPPHTFATPARPRPRPPPMPQQFTPSPNYPDSDGRLPSFFGSKRPRSPAPYGFGDTKRGRANLLSIPSSQMARMHAQPSIPQYPTNQPSSGVKIKAEPGTERDDFTLDGPDSYVSTPPQDDRYGGHDDDDILQLRLNAADAHAKAAQLRLEIAESHRKRTM
ncbi:hypothetical protein K504DRAFT_136501 [Pleomassaria siparia CBS 279.74]|uniref:Uncharacterized protein n=1 Tax=Pleomassaria siparia CBS 279.74 TaxID=1314801 RepID=A0A6G1KLG0_9PLEO|nr:hypothetical protein K504DRAFT_136501 [Pleomassaria siparia CBS 279.74]